MKSLCIDIRKKASASLSSNFLCCHKLSTKDRAKGVLMEFLNSQSFQLLGVEKVPRFIMH
jgi:hypothetical protein